MSFSMSRLDAHWFHAVCLEEWDEMKTEWRRTRVLGMLSTFKYHQALVRALPPVCPHTRHTDRVYDSCKKKKKKITDQALQDLKSPRLSCESLLTILTVDLDVIVASYECAPPRINLSMSFSWCSSCSLVVMVLHCWRAWLWQPTVQPARDSYGTPGLRRILISQPGSRTATDWQPHLS